MRSTNHDPTSTRITWERLAPAAPRQPLRVGLCHHRRSLASGNGAAWSLPEGHSAQTQGLETGTVCSCSHMLAPMPAWGRSAWGHMWSVQYFAILWLMSSSLAPLDTQLLLILLSLHPWFTDSSLQLPFLDITRTREGRKSRKVVYLLPHSPQTSDVWGKIWGKSTF